MCTVRVWTYCVQKMPHAHHVFGSFCDFLKLQDGVMADHFCTFPPAITEKVNKRFMQLWDVMPVDELCCPYPQ